MNFEFHRRVDLYGWRAELALTILIVLFIGLVVGAGAFILWLLGLQIVVRA